MIASDPASIVSAWLSAANAQDITRLLELSDPNIEIVGPRGSGFGYQLLREWLARAGLTLSTQRIFARGSSVVVAQYAIWRSPDTGAIVGESNLASAFQVEAGRIKRYARFDKLDEAFASEGLQASDEVLPAS